MEKEDSLCSIENKNGQKTRSYQTRFLNIGSRLQEFWGMINHTSAYMCRYTRSTHKDMDINVKNIQPLTEQRQRKYL